MIWRVVCYYAFDARAFALGTHPVAIQQDLEALGAHRVAAVGYNTRSALISDAKRIFTAGTVHYFI